MAKANTPEPWERQQEETSKAYEAFCIYRDMGPDRSMRATAEKLGKSQGLMEGWSAKNNWVNRAALWDDEQERKEREIAQKEQAKEIKAMRKRHADLANAMLIKSAKALARIPDDEIRAQDISRMVDVASKLERISRGDVGDVVEERDGGKAESPVTFYLPDNGRDKEDADDL